MILNPDFGEREKKSQVVSSAFEAAQNAKDVGRNAHQRHALKSARWERAGEEAYDEHIKLFFLMIAYTYRDGPSTSVHHRGPKVWRRNRGRYFFVDAKKSPLEYVLLSLRAHTQSTLKKGQQRLFSEAFFLLSLPRLWSSGPTIWKQNFWGGDGAEQSLGWDPRNGERRSLRLVPCFVPEMFRGRKLICARGFQKWPLFLQWPVPHSVDSQNLFKHFFNCLLPLAGCVLCQVRTHRSPASSHMMGWNK